MQSARDFKTFSVAEHYSDHVDPAWKIHKGVGNAALKACNYEQACKHYLDAVGIALGPFELDGTLTVFFEVLEGLPDASPGRRISNIPEIRENIFRHLFRCLDGMVPPQPVQMPPPLAARRAEEGKDTFLKFPNMAAAICWSNRAQALLQLGDAEGALRDAQKATRCAPEYVKGHHREWRALQALGRLKEAAEKKAELDDYEVAKHMYPNREIALLSAGWISWEEQTLIYTPTRQLELMAHIVEQRPSGKKISIRASMVPFQGGQALLLCLDYFPTRNIEGNTGWCSVDGYDLTMCDNENDHMVEELPNGNPSERTFKYAPRLIANAIKAIQDRTGLKVDEVTAGQALLEMIPIIQSVLRLYGPDLADVHVKESNETYASVKPREKPHLLQEMVARLDASMRAAGVSPDARARATGSLL